MLVTGRQKKEDRPPWSCPWFQRVWRRDLCQRSAVEDMSDTCRQRMIYVHAGSHCNETKIRSCKEIQVHTSATKTLYIYNDQPSDITHSYPHSHTHSLSPSLTHSLSQSLTLTRSFTLTLTHSLIHSHSLTVIKIIQRPNLHSTLRPIRRLIVKSCFKCAYSTILSWQHMLILMFIFVHVHPTKSTFVTPLVFSQSHCWLGDRKGIWPIRNLTPAICVGSSLQDLQRHWSELQNYTPVKQNTKSSTSSNNNVLFLLI